MKKELLLQTTASQLDSEVALLAMTAKASLTLEQAAQARG